MGLNPPITLTEQFYAWERHGRGWQSMPFTVQLEPPFTPFYTHYVPEPIIDDGYRPTILSRAASFFKAPPPPSEITNAEERPKAYEYFDDSELCVYAVTFPQHFKQSAERIEQVVQMLSYRAALSSFEIIGTAENITIQWTCREPEALFLRTQLIAFFPDCFVIETFEDAIEQVLDNAGCLITIDYGLESEFMCPLSMPSQLESDPFTGLFGILERLHANQYVVLQVLFTGVQNGWGESITRAVTDNTGKTSFFFDAPEMPALAKAKVSKPLFGVCIRAAAGCEKQHSCIELIEHVSTALHYMSGSTTNTLIPLFDDNYLVKDRLSDILLRESHRVGMLLNSRELINFVHYPSASLHSKKLRPGTHTTKAAPQYLHNAPYQLGINEHTRVSVPVGIDMAQRLRHIHLIGATGTGKSTLLHNLIMQDINSNTGICVLDPHGDLIDKVLATIPEYRIQDVVLIDPADRDYPVGFNILATHSEIERELVASDLVAIFRRFSTSWGDQMNSVFANAIMAFVYNVKVGTLADLRKFLIESNFRAATLATCTDADIVYYWQKEFPLMKGGSVAPILTRLDTFLRPKVIRNMVSQPRGLDFRELMDTNKIVLVKLSQGLLGAENSYLLGAFIVAKIQQIAMARQVQTATDRVPFFCYIDEFHNFITPSMSAILSGARKYSVGLILAHQDMQQVAKYDAEVATSIITNAGTRICFRLGDTDAKRLQDGFSAFSVEDLQRLPIGDAIVRVNSYDNDFNISIHALPPSHTAFQDLIIAHSRETYCQSTSTREAFSDPENDSMEQHDTTLHVGADRQPRGTQRTSADAPVSGQASKREHRAIQLYIKQIAESYGYKVSVEHPIADGTGQIDVLLEKATEQIAVEITVTTPNSWEIHNIEKCLKGSYNKIVVCTTNETRKTQLYKRILAEFSTKEQGRILCITKDEVGQIFISTTQDKDTTSTMKGYRVNIKFGDGDNRQDLLQSIISAANHGK
jgi:hypothetical protein